MGGERERETKKETEKKRIGFISVRCHADRQNETLLLLPHLTIRQSRGSHLGPLWGGRKVEGESAMSM